MDDQHTAEELEKSLKSMWELPKDSEGCAIHWRGYKLIDVLPVLEKVSKNDFTTWTFVKNSQCKYFTLELDSRDGGFVKILDRDGKTISLKELEYQYSSPKDKG